MRFDRRGVDGQSHAALAAAGERFKDRLSMSALGPAIKKGRNVIERCFCRLKDFRRVATRYDKLARNFLAAVHLAAIVAYWIN